MGTELRNEYAYSGLHAYLLIDSVDPSHPDGSASGLVQRLQEEMNDEGPVTSAVEVAGIFQALVHLRFGEADLNSLQTYLAGDIWNGVHHELVFEGPTYTGPMNQLIGFKIHRCDIVAIVKVWVEAGRTREVLGRLGDEIGSAFHGASIVYGSFDILLALEGEEIKIPAGVVLGKLQHIPGIARTETSFTDWRRVPGG